jgi:hypothetical protein
MPISRSNLLAATKRLFRAVGLEVGLANSAVTEHNVLRQLFRSYQFDFLLDVGANAGTA